MSFIFFNPINRHVNTEPDDLKVLPVVEIQARAPDTGEQLLQAFNPAVLSG
jgi:hypothetical protein